MSNILGFLKALTDGQAKTEAASAALELVAKAQGAVADLKAAEQQAVDDLVDGLASDGYLIRTGHGTAPTSTTTTTTTLDPNKPAPVPPTTEGGGILNEIKTAVEEVPSRIPS